MKKGIHPEYKQVVFQDISSGFSFLTRSTLPSTETVEWEDGNTYPVIKVEISSQSHPFYTGKNNFSSRAGRVERFNNKYKKFSKKTEAAPATEEKAAAAEEKK